MNPMSPSHKPELSSSPTSSAGHPAQRHLVAPQLASSITRQGVERELLSAANEALVSKTEELQQQRELFEQLEATFDNGEGEKHMPRAKTWVDGVKQFWSRVTS